MKLAPQECVSSRCCPGDLETPESAASRFYVHAGPFEDFGDAETARAELAVVGTGQAKIVRIDGAFAVRIGPLSTRWVRTVSKRCWCSASRPR